MLEVDLQADVAIDPITIIIKADLVQPDVTTLDASDDCIPHLLVSAVPQFPAQINTTLHPWEARAIDVDKLQDVGVVDVEVTYHSTVLVDPATTKCLIQSRVDPSETDRARRNKTMPIVMTTGSKLTEVNSSPSAIPESMADKPPRSLNAVRSFHRVLDDEDGAGNRKARGGIIEPVLDTASARDFGRFSHLV
jgi:hypothetical protein